MGEVYQALEENLQRTLAIKVLAQPASANEDAVRRFIAEGRALARLEHGNIVRIYALGEHKGQVYMAMEYVDGWTLDEYLRTHFFGLHEIMRLARHMLEGLANAHAAGIVHRDIKPQNVMVDRNLNAKLLDFGIAKLHEDNDGVNTVAGMMLGTLNYIAPEIFNGVSASKQSDIYSLGLVLFLMFNGKSPFVGRTRLEIVEKVANARVRFTPGANTVLPTGLKNIIYKMTAKNVHDRYKNVRDILDDFNRINMNELPYDLRPSLASHMNIECPDELREKASSYGFEYLEIRMVVCLAAEITLKTQNWTGQGNIKIGPQALTEAAQRFVFAKRQMVVRNAYENSGFKVALGAMLTATAFALFTFSNVKLPQKVNEFVAAPMIALPVEEKKPEVKAVVKVETPVEVEHVEEKVESKPVAEAKPAEEKVKAKSAEVKAEAPKAEAAEAERKIASVNQKKPKKKSVKKPVAAAAPAAPAVEEEAPDFLNQKPVLLPTVIERKGHKN